jgi:hypothetical protein
MRNHFAVRSVRNFMKDNTTLKKGNIALILFPESQAVELFDIHVL